MPSRTSGAAKYGVTIGTGAAWHRRFRQACSPEIGEDDPAAHLAHHILRFHIPVYESGPVDCRQSVAQINCDQEGFLRPERAVLFVHLR